MNIFIALSVLFTVGAIIPYVNDVIHGSTKPRIVSWFNWSLLTGIAAAAALADKQYPSAILSLSGSAVCLVVVIGGLKHGDRKFEFFDIACQAGAILGLVLWIVFSSPLVAIIASVSIDFIAGLPTIKHIWQKPHEETRITFVLAAIGALCALAAAQNPHLSGLIFPVYIVLTTSLNTSLFFLTPHRHK